MKKQKKDPLVQAMRFAMPVTIERKKTGTIVRTHEILDDGSLHVIDEKLVPWPKKKSPSEKEIMAAKTKAGGWKRSTLEKWGVPWPPPKGWKKALIAK